MATDYQKIIQNLLEFYDFSDKTVITVGAGGGQLIEYGRAAKNVLAVDNDQTALRKLKENLIRTGLDDKFTLIHSDFYLTRLQGDVVMFEFCLHEMTDAEIAVKHAQSMASDVIITDHWPGSEWAFYVDEEDKVAKSWSAIHRLQLKKVQRYDAVQYFSDYDAIYQKVKPQGENSIRRIETFRHQQHFSIPMSYGFALI